MFPLQFDQAGIRVAGWVLLEVDLFSCRTGPTSHDLGPSASDLGQEGKNLVRKFAYLDQESIVTCDPATNDQQSESLEMHLVCVPLQISFSIGLADTAKMAFTSTATVYNSLIMNESTAFSPSGPRTNCKQLNGASAYFDGGLVEMKQVGKHYVASTRNNAPWRRARDPSKAIFGLAPAGDRNLDEQESE